MSFQRRQQQQRATPVTTLPRETTKTAQKNDCCFGFSPILVQKGGGQTPRCGGPDRRQHTNTLAGAEANACESRIDSREEEIPPSKSENLKVQKKEKILRHQKLPPQCAAALTLRRCVALCVRACWTATPVCCPAHTSKRCDDLSCFSRRNLDKPPLLASTLH